MENTRGADFFIGCLFKETYTAISCIADHLYKRETQA